MAEHLPHQLGVVRLAVNQYRLGAAQVVAAVLRRLALGDGGPLLDQQPQSCFREVGPMGYSVAGKEPSAAISAATASRVRSLSPRCTGSRVLDLMGTRVVKCA